MEVLIHVEAGSQRGQKTTATVELPAGMSTQSTLMPSFAISWTSFGNRGSVTSRTAGAV
jgi:hypothetical protein